MSIKEKDIKVKCFRYDEDMEELRKDMKKIN